MEKIIFATGNEHKMIVILLNLVFHTLKLLNKFQVYLNNDYYSNSLDYAFSAGFQFYPHTTNLSFSIFYSIGTRTDFVKLPERFEQIEKTKWGNGFKIAVEYDFISGGGIIPVLGAYYRFMPRGYDKYDNILSIHCSYGNKKGLLGQKIKYISAV